MKQNITYIIKNRPLSRTDPFLISEGVLAVEMGATAKDLALSVHPHPTLSETIMECAEVFYGHATHTMGKRRANK